jgi:hypothetical protein
MKNLSFVLLLALCAGCHSKQKSGEIQVYCMNRQGLEQVKAAIKRDDPFLQTSFHKLQIQADKAMQAGPFSVLQKTRIPPSGDKHDYLSVPPYTGTGDGLTNPDWWLDYDRVPLERLAQGVETLGLMYYFTADSQYADRASSLLRVWFLDPDTRMNPDLEFAQNSTRIGIIDTRFLPRIIDCIGLLQNAGVWSGEDQAGMVDWCRQFLENLQNRVDRDHVNSGHNIASWYHVQMASLALFTGQDELAKNMLGRTEARIDTALTEEGGFRLELRRTRSLSYSCFHLYALFNLASMAEQLGMDLWHFRTKDGKGLEMALDYIVKYTETGNPSAWPHSEIEGTKGDWWKPYHDMLPSVLYRAAMVYQKERYLAILEEILSDRLDESRIQIMCGIPVRWFGTIDPNRP